MRGARYNQKRIQILECLDSWCRTAGVAVVIGLGSEKNVSLVAAASANDSAAEEIQPRA